MGQSRGVWDYEIYIPFKGVTGTVDCYEIVKVEMKRKFGGQTSSEQRAWQRIYEKAGIPCKVCKGADEAIEFVKSLMQS